MIVGRQGNGDLLPCVRRSEARSHAAVYRFANIDLMHLLVDRFDVGIGFALELNLRGIGRMILLIVDRYRSVRILMMPAAVVSTGERRLRGAVIIRPGPYGIAVGMGVGEVVGHALFGKESCAELCRVPEVSGDVHMIEDGVACRDRARIIKAEIDRVVVRAVRP